MTGTEHLGSDAREAALTEAAFGSIVPTSYGKDSYRRVFGTSAG